MQNEDELQPELAASLFAWAICDLCLVMPKLQRLPWAVYQLSALRTLWLETPALDLSLRTLDANCSPFPRVEQLWLSSVRHLMSWCPAAHASPSLRTHTRLA